jgi:hypothetical protein
MIVIMISIAVFYLSNRFKVLWKLKLLI